jgi:hypothetical protein
MGIMTARLRGIPSGAFGGFVDVGALKRSKTGDRSIPNLFANALLKQTRGNRQRAIELFHAAQRRDAACFNRSLEFERSKIRLIDNGMIPFWTAQGQRIVMQVTNTNIRGKAIEQAELQMSLLRSVIPLYEDAFRTLSALQEGEAPSNLAGAHPRGTQAPEAPGRAIVASPPRGSGTAPARVSPPVTANCRQKLLT